MTRSRSTHSKRPIESTPENFIDEVQLHERSWATQHYNGRPELGEIISASVVVFWKHKDDNGLYRITLHHDLAEIEKYFLRMLFTNQSEVTDKKLSCVYQGHKRMAVSNVKIEFTEADE